jgi:hypothetical protein
MDASAASRPAAASFWERRERPEDERDVFRAARGEAGMAQQQDGRVRLFARKDARRAQEAERGLVARHAADGGGQTARSDGVRVHRREAQPGGHGRGGAAG